eukprot:3030046-Alexandrium_andersonii.AAC.1
MIKRELAAIRLNAAEIERGYAKVTEQKRQASEDPPERLVYIFERAVTLIIERIGGAPHSSVGERPSQVPARAARTPRERSRS